MLHIIIPELVYTLLISVVLYFIILKINQRLERIEKGVQRNLFDTLKEILHKVAKSKNICTLRCHDSFVIDSDSRLFYLQIIKGEEYQDNYSLKNPETTYLKWFPWQYL